MQHAAISDLKIMGHKKQRVLKRFVILGIIVAVIIATGFVLHVARTRSKQRLLSEHLETGMAAYEAGDYETAAEKLGYYNAAISDDPDVVYTLAEAYRKLPNVGGEELRKALNLARTASELAPERPEPLELQLDLYARLGQQTERLATAEKLIALDPETSKGRTDKAMAQVALGQREEALATARELTALTPDDPEAHRLVFAILAGGDTGLSRQHIAAYANELGESHPSDPRFTVLRVHAMALINEFDEAREIASSLMDASFDDDTLVEAVRALDLLGMRDQADALIEKHAEDPVLNQQTALLSVRRAFMRGSIEEAAEIAGQALATQDNPTPELIPWALIAGADVPQEKIDAILAEDNTPSYISAMVEGYRAIEQRLPIEARDAFERAVALRPDDPLAGAMLADALDRVGAWKDAARLREEILRRAPEFTTVRLVHVESLLSRQRPIEADASIREGLRIDQNNGALLLAHLLAVRDMAQAGRALPEEIRGSIRLAQAMEEGEEGITPATIPMAQLMLASDQLAPLEGVLDRIASAEGNTLNVRALLGLAEMMDDAGHPRTEEIYGLIDARVGVDPYVVLERATALADAGDASAGRALIESKLGEAGPQRTLRLEMARAAYLDRIADPSAHRVIADLADEHPESAPVQMLVLESRAGWSNGETISKAVGRLRSITGDNATGWKIQEARRLLTFEPSDQNAATVVTMLSGETARIDPVAQLVLADAMAMLGDDDAAADHLERAIDAGLEDPKLMLRLISIRQSRGELDAARRWAVALSRIEPVTPAIRRERVAALARLGMLETAASDANILAQSPNPRDLVLAANIAAQIGNTNAERARLDALLALETIPDDVLSFVLISLVEAERQDDAAALLERERTANPTVDYILAEATFLDQTGRLDDAAQLVSQAAERTRDIRLLAAKSRYLARQGRTDDALEAAEAGLKLDPENPDLALLRDAINLVDAPSGAQLASGSDEATRRVIEAIRAHTVDTQDREALIQELRTITTEAPTSYPAWSVLVTQLQAAGRLQEAIESAQTAMRLIPGDPRPARLTVDALLLMDEPRGAMAAAQEWANRSRGSREELYEAETTLAALHARLGSNANALRVLEPWADRIKNDPEANSVLVRLLASMRIIAGRPDAAWEIIAPRVEQDPRWLASAIEISRDVIIRDGSVEAARAWLDRVRSTWDGQPEDTLREAQAQLDIASQTGSENDFLAVIETLDELDAMNADADLIERGSALLRIEAERQLGRTEDAARRARTLAAARPGDSMAKSMSALTMIETGGDANEAANLAQQAVRLAQENPRARFELITALNALGRAQVARGSAEEAENTFRRAIGLLERPGAPHIGLAEALIALDRQAEASRIIRDPDLLERVRVSPTLSARLERIRTALESQ